MIRQFDVLPNPSRRGVEERPFVVVIQARIWDGIGTRMCVPLVDERFIRPEKRLNPFFHIRNKRLYFHPLEMTNIPVRLLRQPVANLEDQKDRIVAAIDLVFTGI